MKDRLKYISKNMQGVVIGYQFLRNKEAWESIKNHKLETIHLLNDGCFLPRRAQSNFSRKHRCEITFKENLNNGSNLEQLYAQQSLFPREFHEHIVNNQYIVRFKLSTRPIKSTTLRWDINFLRKLPPRQRLVARKILDNCINSYINNIDEKLFKQTPANLYLWAICRNFYQPVAGFNYNLLELDFNNILEIKDNLW